MAIIVSLITGGPALCQQVTGIEYFFDVDPGYGNGTSVPLHPGVQIDTVLNLTTNGLQDGLHQLFIRVKDSAGHWSLNSFRPFFFFSSAYSNLAIVQRIEYYFDTDPGWGNGQAIVVVPDTSLDIIANIDISGLAPGLHQLNIRAQGGNGFWSLIETRPFLKGLTGTFQTPDRIVAMEYFFDQDPGFGNAIPIPIAPDTSLDIITNIDISGLSSGLHQLNIRAQSGNAFWSLIETRPFLKGPFSAFQTPDRVEAMEYFVDQDPGFGNAIPIPVVPDTSVDIVHNVNLSGYSPGFHTLGVRARGSSGFWSLVQSYPFMLFQGDTSFARVVAAEYYFDLDPGYGNGIAVALDSATTLDTLLTLNTNGLSIDTHRVFLRAKDNLNRWSLTNDFLICLPGKPIAGFEIVQYGHQVSVLDTSTNPESYQYDFGDGGGDSVSHPFHTYLPGVYALTQVVQNFCGEDTAVLLVSIAGIREYHPHFGGNIGSIDLQVSGGGFDTMTTVRLTRNGFQNIEPDTVYFLSSSEIIGKFNLNNQALGLWNVETELPGDTTFIVQNGFEIVPGTTPNPWITVSGPRFVRPGRRAKILVTVGNSGNVNAYGVPFVYATTGNVTPHFKTAFFAPNDTLTYPNYPQYIGNDTLFGTPQTDLKVYPFIVNELPANSTSTLEIDLQINSPSGGNSMAWTYPPIYDNQGTMKPSQVDCLEGSFDRANLGPPSFPLCVSNILNFRNNQAVKDYYDGSILQTEPWKRQGIIRAYFALVVKMVYDCSAVLLNNLRPKTDVMAEFLVDQLQDHIPSCMDNYPPQTPEINPTGIVTSRDPNAIYGPIGANPPHFINANDGLPYRIEFENVDSATAAAQIIKVVDTLGPHYDLSTFSLISFSLYDTTIFFPHGRNEYAASYHFSWIPELAVRMNAKLDTTSGVFEFSLIALDTATNELTQNPFAGILFPNQNPPEGEGSIEFSIDQKPSLSHGIAFENSASIIFDSNAPVITNVWLNTLDTTPPVSQMDLLAPVQHDSIITLEWDGTDLGSGIAFYKLFISKNGSPFRLYSYFAGDTAMDFRAEVDSLYSFYITSIDSVQNHESKSPVGEIVFTYIDTCTYIHSQIDSTLCLGETLFGYSFPGIFIDSFPSPNACDSIRTLHLSYYPMPPTPSVLQIGPDSLSCSLVGDSYQWWFNNLLLPVQTRTIYAGQTGSYAVTLIDTNGCLSSNSAAFAFISTSNEPSLLSESIQIVPNPSDGLFKLTNIPESQLPLLISIRSIWGNEVERFGPIVAENPSIFLDLSHLASGMYSLLIEQDEQKIFRRITIIK